MYPSQKMKEFLKVWVRRDIGTYYEPQWIDEDSAREPNSEDRTGDTQ